MFGVEEEEEKKRARRRPLASPYLVALGGLAVICAMAVKSIFWAPNPPHAPHQEVQLPGEPISRDLSPHAFPPSVSEALRSTKSMVIYLIGIRPQPVDTPGERKPNSVSHELPQGPVAEKEFHELVIFGTARVTSRKAVKTIVESLIRGVERDQDEAMGCFFPRHGVRALLNDGRWIDLVICYQCQRIKVYGAGEPVEVYTFADSRPLLNEALEAAGVNLEQEVVPFMPKP
jgi:hypothetical protein